MKWDGKITPKVSRYRSVGRALLWIERSWMPSTRRMSSIQPNELEDIRLDTSLLLSIEGAGPEPRKI